MAHFHLPKPLHGWREFAGEVGIIVLGVLIALGAEQVVESVRETYLAWQALNNIRSELGYDSAFAAERIAIGDCMRASFRDLRERLIATGDNWAGLQDKPLAGASNARGDSFFASAPALTAPHPLWPVSAWAEATSSGVFNHGQSHFFNYAALYAMVDSLARMQDHEIADYSNLPPLDVRQKFEASTRFQILRNLNALDADNAGLERLAAVFVTAARRNGIPPSLPWLERALRQETASRGACVKTGPELNAALAHEFRAATS